MISQVFFILNPLLERHNGVKVFAMASILSARFVRNFAAMMCSLELNSSSKQHSGPSLSENDSFVQHCDSSSMSIIFSRQLKKEQIKCFPIPLKKTQLANELTLLDRGEQESLRRRYGYSTA